MWSRCESFLAAVLAAATYAVLAYTTSKNLVPIWSPHGLLKK
jgi:hypothetical protein